MGRAEAALKRCSGPDQGHLLWRYPVASIIPIPSNSRFQDITGQRFGRLTVLGYAGCHQRRRLWLCKCDCGQSKLAENGNLRSGGTKSCGCLQRQRVAETKTIHGFAAGPAKAPEYKVWGAMIRRCHNPKDTFYRYYGGRGISVDDRWRFGDDKASAFECFISDMGRRPSKTHQLDRRNNDGPYCIDNCRWVRPVEQNRNRTNSRTVTFRGDVMPLVVACEIAGLRYHSVFQRIRQGWSEERALTEPLRKLPPRQKKSRQKNE